MGKAYQTILQPLPSISITGSASAQRGTVRGRDLLQAVGGRIAHLKAMRFRITLTPTFTSTAPTIQGQNAVVSNCEFYDGSQTRFSGSFNDLRQWERLEGGGIAQNQDPLLAVTTEARYFNRTLGMGPRHFAGSPTDFVMPCAALEQAEWRLTFGVLTDISAGTTAYTCVIQPVAELVLLDELRLPPHVERKVYSVTGDNPITGRALYAFAGLGNSASWDAISAGDFANVTISSGNYDVVPSVNVGDLRAAYEAAWEGHHSGLFYPAGEPASATDLSPRILNGTTPTALKVAEFDMQPVLWCGPNAQISKILCTVESSLRYRHSGTQTGASPLLVTRILAQPPSVLATIADRAARALNIKGGSLRVKTLSKEDYKGPLTEFMPYTVKL
jgi:hypothetical protein